MKRKKVKKEDVLRKYYSKNAMFNIQSKQDSTENKNLVIRKMMVKMMVNFKTTISVAQ